MFLSIVIPIYNDDKYLTECLDSCLEQEISLDEYEIICVDDGSTDRTPDILKEYATKYSNIRLMMMERHKGGRTVGYLQAKGDYIWFVDHDDLIAPNSIPELKRFVEQNPEADRIFFSYYQFQNELTDEELERFREGTLWANDGDRNRYAVVWDSLFKHSFLLMNDILPWPKRIKEAGEYWGIPSFRVWSVDSLFNEEFFDCGGKTIVMEGKPLYHYRLHSGSEQNNKETAAVKERQKRRYYSFLYEIYLVIHYKEEYLKAKTNSDPNIGKLIRPVMVKLIGAVQQLSTMPAIYWKQGMMIAKERNVFFSKMPEEYKKGFSWFDFMRMQSKLDHLRLHVALHYYLYSETAARIYRFVMLPHRLVGNSTLINYLKIAIKKVVFRRDKPSK